MQDDEEDVSLEVLEAAARAPEERRRLEIDDDASDLDLDRRCSICLSLPGRGQRCSLLPCGHSSFCVSCIRQWLLQSSRNTCPLCLQRVKSFVDGRGTEVVLDLKAAPAAAGGGGGDDDDDAAAVARSLRNWVAAAGLADPYGGGESSGRLLLGRVPASNGAYSRGVARLAASNRGAATAAAARASQAPSRRRRREEEEEESLESPGLQWRRDIYRWGLERAGGGRSDRAAAAAAVSASAAAAPSAGTSTSTTPAPWAIAARVSLWCRRDLEALLGRSERDAVDVAASVVEGLWRSHGIAGVEAAAAAAAAEEAASAPAPSSSSGATAAVAAGSAAARSLAPILDGGAREEAIANGRRRNSSSASPSSSTSLSSRNSSKFWRELWSFAKSGLTVDAYDRTFRYRGRAGGGGGGGGAEQQQQRQRGRGGGGTRDAAAAAAAATSAAAAPSRGNGATRSRRSPRSRSRSGSPPSRGRERY